LLVVLFGIGTDYFLFLMFRYRERLRLGDDKKEAMVQSVTRVGEIIASAACVVIAAFLALTLSSLSIFRSLGPTLAIAVAVTLIAALTLIPAVVSLIGTAVFWPSKAWQREPKGAAFTAIGGALGRRPAVFAAAPGLVLILLALGALGLKPTFDLSSAGIPATAESQTALVTLEKGFPPGETEPTQVYLHTSSGTLTTAEVTSYEAKLRAMPGVGAVASPLTSTDGATPRVAAAHALAQAGPAIASAGLILAGTFGSLTLAGNQVLTQVGFAVAAGIALAAFVTAMFFSPSLTALIGRRAWWPGHSGQAAARQRSGSDSTL